MKVLVTGASGLLGRAVVERLKEEGHSVTGTGLTRSTSEIVKLDLTDADAVDQFLNNLQPQAIVHSAAERRPDVVESSPEASRHLNVEVPSHIAQWCKARGQECPLLINISTDYVFDGVSPPFRVDDAPNPLNAYGMSKWEGEKGVRESGKQGRATSLRVPVLYGRTETNSESAVNVLLDAISGSGSSKAKKMDANAVRYPTCVSDVARALALLCDKFADPDRQIPPTLHFSAMEAMTKYDMCLVMARSLRAAGEEAGTDHLEAEYEVDPNAATSRPRHCKLDLSVIKEQGIDVECVSFEGWWREYLNEYAVVVRAQREKEAAEAQLEEKRKRDEEAEKRRIEAEEEEKRRREEEEERIRIEAEEESRRQEIEERQRQEEKEQERLKDEEEARQKEEREKQEERMAQEVQKEQDESEKASQDEANRQSEGDVANREQGQGQVKANAAGEEGLVRSGEEESGSPRDQARPSSSTAASSLRTVSSPNPSFSSLQARPTPPATSGRSSPSPSVLSSQAKAIPATLRESEEGSNEQLETSASTSLTEVMDEDMARQNPLLTLEQASLANAKTEAKGPDRVEEPGFFPSALAETSGSSSLGINFSAAAAPRSRTAKGSSGDADSDGYGQPSPRDPSPQPPFAAGYGEVPYGLTPSGKQEASQADTVPANADDHPIEMPKSTRPTFQIRVGDPQKIGDPMTAHIVYTVRVKTDCPRFRASHFSVLRRYNDFRWLHAALVHNNAGIFIPPVPEKVKIGRFAPDLVEARRHGLETCINKIANNATLQMDDDFKLFLESSQFAADVKARDQVKGPVPTPEQKTYFGWSTSLTGSTYKYHETDEWFDEQQVHLDHLESQLKGLVRVISTLAQQRKEIAAAIAEFSHAFMMLSGSSLSRSLSTCFAGLGEVQRRTFELADVQADADVRDFGSVIYQFERMVGSARKAFSTRIDAWQAWQKLEDESRRVRTRHEKLKRESQGGHRVHDGRLDGILDEVAAIDKRCLNQKREFDLIGRRCKEEMDRFEWERISAFEEAALVWLQGMIERNQELTAEWEQYASLLERQTGQKVLVE